MATPTLVQHVAFILASGGLEGSVFHYPLPNPTLPGNCLVVAVAYLDTTTLTITDDQGNSYGSPINTDDDAGNGYKCEWYVVPNCATGTSKLSLTFATGHGPEFVSLEISEWYNVATASPLDGSGAHTHSSGTSWGPGSVTTTQANSLILTAMYNSQGVSPITFSGLTAGFSWLAGQESTDTAQHTSFAVAYKVQTSAGSVSPTITTSSGSGFIASAIALKSATAGTAPTATPRVVGITWLDMHSSIGANALTFKTPSFGDIFAFGVVGGADIDGNTRTITSVVDSKSNSYTKTTGVGNGTAGIVAWAYCVGTSAGHDMTTTVTMAGTSANTNGDHNVYPIVFFDIIGAAAGCTFDAVTSNTGLQSVGGNLSTVTVTPARANGLYLCVLGVNQSTVRDVVSSGGTTVNPWYLEEDGNTESLHEDNGAGLYYNPNTSPFTFTWSENNAVADWAAQVIGFIPPATVSTTSLSEDGYMPSAAPAAGAVITVY